MTARPDTAKLAEVFGDIVPAIEQVSEWRKPKTPPSEPQSWDRHPLIIVVKGVEREYFTIGALASALGRTAVTIRSWEQKRWFPPPPYRTGTPDREPLPGKVLAGRRLYTRRHIEAVIAAAKASGVYDPANALSANWSEFTRLVWLAWKTLREQPT
jgi:hypothetical protein